MWIIIVVISLIVTKLLKSTNLVAGILWKTDETMVITIIKIFISLKWCTR